ncbi:malate synthase [Edaphobacillus lindanitolerans]|uniref:Malate synthase G n=2 Tax=Edaphobacillus lindanitolerans TaxID=550447 RepID=A0A1U7PNJ5_9BACI|nr:malate synthase [Edaphobacillus lindanitolerans]
MYKEIGKLKVAQTLCEFIEEEALNGVGVDKGSFWKGFEQIVEEFAGRNKSLLEERKRLQKIIDDWHEKNEPFDPGRYQSFLKEIGYVEDEVEDFTISTSGVDSEIANQSGPQLVVPLDNARFALNAANARWGSLYDALYGTDVIGGESGEGPTAGYNPVRGNKVIEYSKAFLDEVIPLKGAQHRQVVQYSLSDGSLSAKLSDGSNTSLINPEAFIGYQGDAADPHTWLFKNYGIHIELKIDRDDPIGSTDEAGVKDILLEAALTTIMDCEDAVAAVDTEDKLKIYRNWLGLMQGTLSASFEKEGKRITRVLAADREYQSANGDPFSLKGRSLLLVRNVGHLMTSEAVMTANGEEVPEGIIDAVVTSLIAMHSFDEKSAYGNSAEKSIYIVKPKMHGSKEVAFTNDLFDRVEDLLGLPRHTIKMGVMDEERRTSLNLKNCIFEARERIVFINTGFLDRTGDEIHTAMKAGAMIRKNDMKTANWLQAYERSNVLQGLLAGFRQRAQIGKGMWAMPDQMKAMLEQKINQPLSGASTAWVPSPTAATLHAMHFHQVNVQEIQLHITGNRSELRTQMQEVPLSDHVWSDKEIQEELENNIQGILGYVVRWIDQGIGCSKVPDIHGTGLMEDRATLRISSQHLANWLMHGVCTEEQITGMLKKMAKVVDEQNIQDPNYRRIGDNYDNSLAFKAAHELIFSGAEQPNGYTEPILHYWRKEAKKEYAKTGVLK